ncbi:hypothetical protein CRG98_037924 [Punica granatum]|uniref:Uncharacterized protein n=1 Tax=Punica granatum TaxID=22663 RepID=A0A2I0ICZ4_PUNGR|nr:hypothetical protein CRG98_037924 [Punica granatum]
MKVSLKPKASKVEGKAFSTLTQSCRECVDPNFVLSGLACVLITAWEYPPFRGTRDGSACERVVTACLLSGGRGPWFRVGGSVTCGPKFGMPCRYSTFSKGCPCSLISSGCLLGSLFGRRPGLPGAGFVVRSAWESWNNAVIVTCEPLTFGHRGDSWRVLVQRCKCEPRFLKASTRGLHGAPVSHVRTYRDVLNDVLTVLSFVRHAHRLWTLLDRVAKGGYTMYPTGGDFYP